MISFEGELRRAEMRRSAERLLNMSGEWWQDAKVDYDTLTWFRPIKKCKAWWQQWKRLQGFYAAGEYYYRVLEGRQ